MTTDRPIAEGARFDEGEPVSMEERTCERKLPGFPPVCGKPAVAHIVPGSGFPAWYACAEHVAKLRAIHKQHITPEQYRDAVARDPQP